MRRTLYILSYISIFLLLNACTQTEDYSENNQQSLLMISPEIDDSFTTTYSQENNFFTANDIIGLYAVPDGNIPQINDEVYNQKIIYNGNSWSSAQQIYWPEGNQESPYKLYAYYPYSQTMINFKKTVFSVSKDQSTQKNLDDCDVLWGKSVVNKQNDPVKLQMSHQFSILTINVKYDQSISTDRSLQIHANTSALLNMEDGEIVSTSNPEEISPLLLNAAPEGYNESYAVIIPPQTIQNSPFIYLNIKEEVYQLPISKIFEKGKQYSLNVIVKKAGTIVLEGIYVSAWDKQVNVTDGFVQKNKKIYRTGDVIEYHKATVAKPVTLVVLGDGFTQSDLQEDGWFEQNATKAIEFMFSTEPFKTYRDYFNIYFIAAESNESGADNTTEGTKKDTYFNSGWGNSYSDMKADEPKVSGFVEKYCPDIINKMTNITRVPVFILVNENRYGGICWINSNGKAYMMCPLIKGTYTWAGINPNITGYSKGDWRNIFLHEGGGHAFAKLQDEYYSNNNSTYNSKTINSHNYAVPYGKNITANIAEESITNYWKHMKGYSPKVGYFEGALGYSKGIWRCENISCMIDNRRYFNAYSRQLIVERIKLLAGEKFDYNDFQKKDINYDEILDGKGKNGSGVFGIDTRTSDVKIAPPLPHPMLVDY